MQQWIFDLRSRSFLFLVIAFVTVSMLVYSETTATLDHTISGHFSNLDGFSYDVMRYVSETGDVFYLLFFAIIILLIRRTRKIGISLMILLVITTLFTGYVKCAVDRDRPYGDVEPGNFPIPIGHDTFALFCDGGLLASYPSGHAARTMAFAVILGYALSQRFPRGCYLILAYPALVSLSRVYLVEHYPMDVIGGLIIGALLAGVLAKKTRLYAIFEPSKV